MADGEKPFEHDKKYTIAKIWGKLAQWKDYVRWNLVRDLKPRVIVGMKSDGTPINIWDSNGFPKYRPIPDGELLTEVNTPSDNSDPTITTTSDEEWEIVAIWAGLNCAAAAGNRNLKIQITQVSAVTITAATVSWESDAVTGGNNNDCQVYLTPHGGATNDNGTVAMLTNTSPLPVIAYRGCVIKATFENKNAGDRASMRVMYRKVSV